MKFRQKIKFFPDFSTISPLEVRVRISVGVSLIGGLIGVVVGGILGGVSGVAGKEVLYVLTGGIVLGLFGVLLAGATATAAIAAEYHGSTVRKKEQTANKLKKPPFSFLRRLSQILPTKYGRSLEQEVSDMRIEYFEALNKNNIQRARMIVVFYYIGLSWSAVKWIAERAKELVGFMPKVN